MADPEIINITQAAKTGPVDYQVPASVELVPLAIHAIFNGAAASSSFLCACTYISSGGLRLSRVFPVTPVAAGDTAEVTFAPFLADVGGTGGTVGGPISLKVVRDPDNCVVGDNQLIFMVPASLAGTTLTTIMGYLTTASGVSDFTAQLRNVTTGFYMLSSPITIDAGEFSTYTAAVPPIISTTHGRVSQGDLISADILVAPQGSRGFGIEMTFV